MATYAFDPNVFDFAFGVYDLTPSLYKVDVQPTHGIIQAGQSVNVTIYIVDDTSTPGKVFPLTTASLPTIEIFDPSDTSIVAATNMTQIETGVYTYVYNTTSGHVKGSYSALFKADNGVNDMASKKMHVFSIR